MYKRETIRSSGERSSIPDHDDLSRHRTLRIPLYSQVRERLRERIADGTYVAHDPPSQELARLEGFGEAMSRKGHRIVNRAARHALVEASPAVAARLRVEPGAALLRIERLTWTADGVPLDFEYLYVRAKPSSTPCAWPPSTRWVFMR